MQRFNVDLALGGHNHFYERSLPIVASAPTTTETSQYENPEGFIQVTTGGAGAGLYEFKQEPFYPHDADHDRRHNRVIAQTADNQVTMEALSSVFVANQTLDKFTLITSDEEQDVDTSVDVPTPEEAAAQVQALSD